MSDSEPTRREKLTSAKGVLAQAGLAKGAGEPLKDYIARLKRARRKVSNQLRKLSLEQNFVDPAVRPTFDREIGRQTEIEDAIGLMIGEGEERLRHMARPNPYQ